MSDIPIKVSSAAPPCDFGCAMKTHCKMHNDKCQQYKHWENSGKIDKSKDRTPQSFEVGRARTIKKRKQYLEPRTGFIHKDIKQALNQLSDEDLEGLSKLVGYSTRTLKSYRSLHRGLSENFVVAMSKISAQQFINERTAVEKAA